MSDTITIPASYIGTPDAELTVDYDGMRDSYRMTLAAADGQHHRRRRRFPARRGSGTSARIGPA
jgi:hypothetical protein